MAKAKPQSKQTKGGQARARAANVSKIAGRPPKAAKGPKRSPNGIDPGDLGGDAA